VLTEAMNLVNAKSDKFLIGNFAQLCKNQKRTNVDTIFTKASQQIKVNYRKRKNKSHVKGKTSYNQIPKVNISKKKRMNLLDSEDDN